MFTSLGVDEVFIPAILSYHLTLLLGNCDQARAPLLDCHLKYLKKFHYTVC